MVISKKTYQRITYINIYYKFYLIMLKGINYNSKKYSLVYKFNFLYILKFKL